LAIFSSPAARKKKSATRPGGGNQARRWRLNRATKLSAFQKSARIFKAT
jgi:hypothetical protein